MHEVQLFSVLGNAQKLDGGAMFGNVPRIMWEKWLPPDELGRVPLACRALFIVEPHRKILCETGIGAFFAPKFAERYGVQTPSTHLLLENLKHIHVEHEDVDLVILSHLHFDHAGGLLPPFGDTHPHLDGLLFPKAQFVVSEEAWKRAKAPHPRDKASFIPGLVEKLEASKRLHIFTGKDGDSMDVCGPQIEFYQSHGHSPGHLHTLYKGRHKKIFFCGDLVPGLPWAHIPVTMGYDRFPELVIDEKAHVYKKGIQEEWLWFFTHDPEYACATLTYKQGNIAPGDMWKQLHGIPM